MIPFKLKIKSVSSPRDIYTLSTDFLSLVCFVFCFVSVITKLTGLRMKGNSIAIFYYTFFFWKSLNSIFFHVLSFFITFLSRSDTGTPFFRFSSARIGIPIHKFNTVFLSLFVLFRLQLAVCKQICTWNARYERSVRSYSWSNACFLTDPEKHKTPIQHLCFGVYMVWMRNEFRLHMWFYGSLIVQTLMRRPWSVCALCHTFNRTYAWKVTLSQFFECRPIKNHCVCVK